MVLVLIRAAWQLTVSSHWPFSAWPSYVVMSCAVLYRAVGLQIGLQNFTSFDARRAYQQTWAPEVQTKGEMTPCQHTV